MPAVAPRDLSRSPFERGERPRRLEGREARQLFEPGKATLDERIAMVWSGLVESGAAQCPLCHGEMRLDRGCSDCGSQLS